MRAAGGMMMRKGSGDKITALWCGRLWTMAVVSSAYRYPLQTLPYRSSTRAPSYGHVGPVKVAWRMRPFNPLRASDLNGTARYRRCCINVAAVRFSRHLSLNLQGVFRGKNVSPGRPDVTDSVERISAGALIKSVGWKDLGFAVGCRNWSVSARPVVPRTSIDLVDRVLPGNTR
ncbi:MAG: hypothetical protein Q9173_000449 [Seirophora scorigena]